MTMIFMKTMGENILYYNAIADEYNSMLDKNLDRIIREKVAQKFSDIVEGPVALDFGGGTGLDLPWLSDKNDTIFFCEPSKGMREIAIRSRGNLANDNVIFLEDFAADFRQWQQQLPFPEKVDTILSNFAVFNCIPDIEFLFRNLAVVIKPGGNLIALVLGKAPKIANGSFRRHFKSIVHHEPATINITYKENQQTVYMYSLKEIMRASGGYFNFCSSEVLPGSGFTLIHLKRK